MRTQARRALGFGVVSAFVVGCLQLATPLTGEAAVADHPARAHATLTSPAHAAGRHAGDAGPCTTKRHRNDGKDERDHAGCRPKERHEQATSPTGRVAHHTAAAPQAASAPTTAAASAPAAALAPSPVLVEPQMTFTQVALFVPASPAEPPRQPSLSPVSPSSPPGEPADGPGPLAHPLAPLPAIGTPGSQAVIWPILAAAETVFLAAILVVWRRRWRVSPGSGS